MTAIQNSDTQRGVGIGEVAVRRPQSVTLATMTYDEDFSLGLTNKSRGKPTTIQAFDESTMSPGFLRQLQYVQPEGQLSKETVTLDWDRSGNSLSYASDYSYDTMGRLYQQVLPYASGSAEMRTIEYGYRRGALVGLTSSWDGASQAILPDALGTTGGVEYNTAGGVQRLHYGNGTTTEITPNDAYMPGRIRVWHGTDPAMWDTGLYAYDGARNITAIGTDAYRYDLAGRLMRAKVDSSGFPTGLKLDYGYDRFGNMHSRQTDDWGVSGRGPAGIHFVDRSFDDGVNVSDNQIHDAGFDYDDNGNMTAEPTHDSVGGYRYGFTPENRLGIIRDYDSQNGTIYQDSRYDAEGNRWARIVSNDGGKALITLRDASGQVVADFEADSASDPPQPVKHYIHAAGGLVATHTQCGPAPLLGIEANQNLVGQLRLNKSIGAGFTPTGDFAVYITSDAGAVNTLTLPVSTPDVFSINLTELFPGNNHVRIQAEGDCGKTGYSNAVSTNPSGGGACVGIVALTHAGTLMLPGMMAIEVAANPLQCDPATYYSLWYQPEGGGAPTKLGAASSTSYRRIKNMPAGAGHGEYYFTEYDPVLKVDGAASATVTNDVSNSGDGSTTTPGTNAWRTEYVHKDHLGSTRLITDEMGLPATTFKFYPFGHYAEISGGGDTRMKFTGHERDDGTGLDYMRARYYGAALGLYGGADPFAIENLQAGSRQEARQFTQYLGVPLRWNKYIYVLSNPLRAIDPNGLDAVIVIDPSTAKTVKHGSHTETLYEATVYKNTTLKEYTEGKVGGKSTETVDVGVTAEKQPNPATPGGDVHGSFKDTPPGTFEVTLPLPTHKALTSMKGLAYNSPREPAGVVVHNGIIRYGMGIHEGRPCNSFGCVTSPEFSKLKTSVLPDLQSGNPVHMIVPNVSGKP